MSEIDDVDDNVLADYDLSAWEVPPPAAGLADAVVRRARDRAPHAIATPRSLKPWVILAGSLAALVAILAIVMWGIERTPADGSGIVAAAGPRTLDLGRSSATLDAGTQLAWTRRGGTVSVSQSRGGAVWRVGKEDTLVIDAAVASIEAKGASLRVEVSMNRSDVRAMGVGSAAAIVVSLVTVIVYEGHVKATSSGQTVTIQPGATMSFGEKPTPPEQLSVGGGNIDDARKRISELELEIAKLRFEILDRDAEAKLKEVKDAKDAKDAKDTEAKKATCDEVWCVLNNYEGRCCDKYNSTKVVADAPCDAAAPNKKGDDYLSNGMDVAALAQFEKSLACKPDLAVAKKALLAACRSKDTAKANKHFAAIPSNLRSNYAQICLRYGISLDTPPAAPPPPCDAAALKKKGDDYLGNGMDIAALAQFEASLNCKFDDGVVKTAFLAACRSKQPTKAKRYFAQLPASMASNYVQICLRYGIDVEPTSTVTKGTGFLRIESYPIAMIEIDGVPAGDAPLRKQLPVGKHKVTFVVGQKKHTYTVTVKDNETTSLRKDFEAGP